MSAQSHAGPSAGPPQAGASAGHVPVMLAEMLQALAPRDGGTYLDGTFGGGGYAEAILRSAACTLWAIDRDPDAIARGAGLAARFPGRLHLLRRHFRRHARPARRQPACIALDGVVLDLGVSSFQLDDPARGFSFRTDGPLDMRMGRSGPTAADLVNTLPERELADMLFEFGEERASRRIARAIVAARAEAPIATTGTAGRDHPRRAAARPFRHRSRDAQLPGAAHPGERRTGRDRARPGRGLRLLAPGGRLVVVAFHSLEDRIVKRFMTDAAGRAPAPSRHDPRGLLARTRPHFRLLTPRAVRPGATETQANPRARSARLARH